MKKISIHMSKSLKLQNALSITLTTEEELKQLDDIETLVNRMDLYIRKNGAQPMGPLIQKTMVVVDNDGVLSTCIVFYRQASSFIHSTQQPYRMDSILRVPDCLYTRFVGEEKDLQIAYSKLNVVAYEEEIKLSGETYTVYVEVDGESDAVVTDVFMPRAIE